MSFDALTDLRRLLGDFIHLDYDDPTLQQMLSAAAQEAARLGLLLQEQEVIDLQAGVAEYAVHPRWVQTFAVLREDVQAFFAIRDQNGKVWYVYVNEPGEFTLTDVKPAGVDLTVDPIPFWVRVLSADLTPWFLYPSPLPELIVSTVSPSGNGWTAAVDLTSRSRVRWTLGATDDGELELDPFALTAAKFQSYINLQDQAHVNWFVTSTDVGSLQVLSVRPPGLDLTPLIPPHWLEWQSPNGSTWYVYPSPLGSLLVQDAAPALGGGITDLLELVSPSRRRWDVRVTNQGSLRLTRDTSADPALAGGGVKALTIILPEAYGRLDPDADPGPPVYATVWQGRLWVWPVPDAAYQLDHKFFAVPMIADGLPDMPKFSQRLYVWRAFATALRSSGRVSAAASVGGIFTTLLAYYAKVYSPSERDSREEITLIR